ncbi:hypothetical protein L0F63_006568, partial [Massospora cicadina]
IGSTEGPVPAGLPHLRMVCLERGQMSSRAAPCTPLTFLVVKAPSWSGREDHFQWELKRVGRNEAKCWACSLRQGPFSRAGLCAPLTFSVVKAPSRSGWEDHRQWEPERGAQHSHELGVHRPA